MKKFKFFHSYLIACFVAILMIFVACDTEMTNEEILNSNMETITHTLLVADSSNADTQKLVKVYAYIDKDGEVSLLNCRVLQSSGKDEVDDMVLKYLSDDNFYKTVKKSTNGKEVIYDFIVKYYKPHPDIKFIKYDKAPKPIGGFAAIQKNVVYPKVAQVTGIEGAVVVQGYIDDNGNMSKFNILRGIENSGLNEAAVNALKKTKFLAAEQEGKKVGVWITIPIVFRLD